jgi:hypothetical protein
MYTLHGAEDSLRQKSKVTLTLRKATNLVMEKVTFKEAKKTYDSYNTVYFVDENDLTHTTVEDAAIEVKNDGKDFTDHTKDWYMFNYWGNAKPELTYYV